MGKIKKIKWFSSYSIQFILIFISVLLAFMLSEWSNDREERISELKILTEIRNSLERDLFDVESNIQGYKLSMRSSEVLEDWLNKKAIPQDSINLHYQILFRNYTPIINRSAYESLKATSLKTVSNDSLRLEIISVYDYYYRILEKLEDEIYEMQDYRNHSKIVNEIISPYMQFNDELKLVGLLPAEKIDSIQEGKIKQCLWKTKQNRIFKLQQYKYVREKIKELKAEIEKELKKE